MKTIDAKNQSLGRVASQAAKIILGKHTANYEPHKITGEEVHITNASKITMTDRKLGGKKYPSFTGYPGGLNYIELRQMIEKKGYGEVFKKAVKRMLPANRLQKERLKMLKVTE